MQRRGPKAWLTTTAPHSQVWASDHSTKLNLFCPLPPPCPIVQRPQKSKLFASAECLPSMPQREPGHQSQGWLDMQAWMCISGWQAAGGTDSYSRAPWCPLFTAPSLHPLLFPSSPVPSLAHISLFACVYLTYTVYYVLSPVPPLLSRPLLYSLWVTVFPFLSQCSVLVSPAQPLAG